MNAGDQKLVMPMMGGASGAAGGKPKWAPRPSPTKNQKRTAASAQSTAEVKNSFGLGKNETNTVSSLSEKSCSLWCYEFHDLNSMNRAKKKPW